MKILYYLFGVPKTLYFNLRNFSVLTALRFPVVVSNKTVLKTLKGKIRLEGQIKPGMVRIGFGDVDIFDRRKSRTIFSNRGEIIFRGKAKIGHGAKIVVKKNASLTFGNRFNMSAESTVYCHKAITFGNYNLMSWDVLVMDSDIHSIYPKDAIGNVINPPKPVITGDSVWFGSRCLVLKGATVADNTIIAANTTVVGELNEPYSIWAGNPAKVIKRNVFWDSAVRDYI